MHLSPGLHVSHFLFYFDSPSCLVCYIWSCFPCPVSQILFSCVSRCVHCALIPSCVFIVHVPLVLCCILSFCLFKSWLPSYLACVCFTLLPEATLRFWLYTCVLGTALWVHSLPSTCSASHAIHFQFQKSKQDQIIQERVFSLHNIFLNLAWNHNNNSHLISQGTTLNAKDCYQEALGNTTEHVTEVDILNSKEPNNSIHNA